MKTALIRIGDSRGIRIPKSLIEECGLRDVVDLRVENSQLIVSRERRVRVGWSKAFLAAGASGSDEMLLDGLPANELESKEWKW